MQLPYPRTSCGISHHVCLCHLHNGGRSRAEKTPSCWEVPSRTSVCRCWFKQCQFRGDPSIRRSPEPVKTDWSNVSSTEPDSNGWKACTSSRQSFGERRSSLWSCSRTAFWQGNQGTWHLSRNKSHANLFHRWWGFCTFPESLWKKAVWPRSVPWCSLGGLGTVIPSTTSRNPSTPSGHRVCIQQEVRWRTAICREWQTSAQWWCWSTTRQCTDPQAEFHRWKKTNVETQTTSCVPNSHGPLFKQLHPHIQSQIKKIHQNLGHPDSRVRC